MVGRFFLVFTVQDEGVNNIRSGYQYYTDTFIELLKWRNNGQVHIQNARSRKIEDRSDFQPQETH